MKTLLTFLIILLSLASVAQISQPNMLFLKTYEGVCSVAPNISPQRDGGFVILISASSGVGTVDSLCSTIGDKSIFLKYSADGSLFEWTKCYAGNFDDSGFMNIFSTPDDGYILGGVTLSDTHEFLVRKENSSGVTLWSKAYGDSAEAIPTSMIATNDGGYIIAGVTNYTSADFPVHHGSFTDADIAVIKIDVNGNKIWSKVLGGTLQEECSAIVSAPSGGSYIIGTTLSNDFDCSGNHGESDGYVVRLDADGNVLWHKDVGGTGFDGGDAAWPDGHGGVIVAGNTNSHDGDVTHYVGGVWVIDIDSTGNILWNNSFGNAGAESPYSICKATDGSIWIAAASGPSGGEINTNYGRTDAWFIHADSGGNFLNARVLGSHQDDKAQMVYPLSNGNVFGGGYYDTTGGVFPLILWSGGGAFLTVFAPWPEKIAQISLLTESLKIYPNPSYNEVYLENTKPVEQDVVITDMLGRIIYKAAVENKAGINVGNWQRGIYYVQASGSDGCRSVQKFTVE